MKKNGNFISRSISSKLIAMFLIISIIPVIMIGILSYYTARNSLERFEYKQLESVGVLKTEQITNYLNNKFNELDVLSRSDDAFKSYQILKKYHDEGGSTPAGPFNIESARYQEIFGEVNPFFEIFMEAFNFHDMYFICAEHGHVMYSYDKGHDLGTNLITGPYKNSGLAELWKSVKKYKKPMLVDFSIYGQPEKPSAFLGAPIFNKDDKIVAIIALQLDIRKIDDIMQERSGLGESGETYLVGDDFLMRSDSRFTEESTILKRKVETESVKLALEDKTGIHIINDYRGIPVLSYYSYIELDKRFGANFNWVVISEIDESEAFASANLLANEVMIVAIIIAVVVIILAFIFARYFTKPIKKITQVAKAGAIGDFRQSFKVKQKDEVGELAKAFRSMQVNMMEKAEQAIQISGGDLTLDVKPLSDKDEMGNAFRNMVNNLREQLNDINEVVSILTSSNSQLMSTIAQLSSSSNETATTVSEVTTTIEEVQQTAEVSVQKAKNVSVTAQKSVQISESGIRSTEDSLEGMNKIQEQVKQIADTIIKLSEQSQTIGEITSSVNDLAEQSNLLAVNASIEAVKAGEYGKGFGVVAQEIRALADQSKQSTKQIRDILNDVQKAISSAVMATEQGGKAVDKGLTLAESSGDSISMLADSISEAAQASSQIAASSSQQLTGMEQLAAAMENIKLAATQNASGTKQAEEAVSNIKTIVENLKNLVNKYQIKK